MPIPSRVTDPTTSNAHPHSAGKRRPEPEFIFPQPKIASTTTTPDADETPRMSAKTRLPHSESELSLSNTLDLEEPSSSMKSSLAISSLRTDSSSSGHLRGSVGTLLSLAPSSMFTVPSSSADHHVGEAGGKERRPRKEEKKQLSGLSLSRPSSIDGEGYTSPDHDASDSSSTSSSPSSSSGSSGARQVLSPENPTRPVTLLNRRPLPMLLAVHSRTSSSVEGNNNYPSIIASTTPTATVTPLGTPRASIVRPLPTSVIDIEKQKGVDYESAPHQQQHGSASSAHGQGHVRWRSPLRISGRDLELDCEGRVEGTWGAHRNVDEETPLLVRYEEEETMAPAEFQYGPRTSIGKKKDVPILSKTRRKDLKARIKKELHRAPEYAVVAMKSIPAVLLGCLLNILDGVSYGMIIFPATGVFENLGPMGVSMFFVSTIVSQLVYTLGGSGFAGANGSMMIEVVPFFHIMASNIADRIGSDDPVPVIATTLVAYSFSSLLTGLSFLLLGALRLGTVVGFFPRHILVGCIGGVGAFLIETGLTISLRISEDEFSYSLETLSRMFEGRNFVLWILPLFLAVLLRLITRQYQHQLVFPLYFLMIPAIFYVIVTAAKLDLSELRTSGWLFDMGSAAHEPWYRFYTYFDFGKVRYDVLVSTLPTQFALLFFNILHPPLNVPALAVSLDDDVDTNKELVAHGYSNFLSGIVGSVPNYLVYVNTLLFYRVGGGNRVAGLLLAILTAALLIIGPWPIAYIPVMVVGALIFVLGIDLVKEALWDNRHRASWSEYITIVSIMITMTVWDFVIGVLFGIIACCFFFVVQNSQRRSIRAIYTGDHAMSAVRRPSLQRAYIREVSRQTTILRLQGFLFFGTITHVEESIRSLTEGPHWQLRPVQFLVLDLTLVAGIDMSSAEAFVRIHRLLSSRFVTLVFCGFDADSPIGRSLSSVDVLGAPGVVLFATFNDATEWTENAYLRAWFRSQKMETSPVFLAVPGRQDPDIEYDLPADSFVRSPRRSQIRDAGERTIAAEVFLTSQQTSSEPYQTLRKAFSSYGTVDPVLFRPISIYLERMTVPEGTVLWRQGEPPNGLYVIEAGVLRASYAFGDPAQQFEESMVAGTLAGELSALAESPRNATVMVEHGPAVMWKLSGGNLKRMQIEEPELARVFVQLVLKAAKLDYDVLLAAIASRQ